MVKAEQEVIKSWKLKLALLMAIVVPTVAATGSIYDLKAKIIEKEAAANQRISDVELKIQKNFADKDTVREIRNDIKDMRSDLNELKTLIIRKSR